MKRFFIPVLFCFFSCNCLLAQTSEKKLRFAFLTDIHLNATNDGERLDGLKQALAKVKELDVDFIITGGDQLDVSSGSKNYVSRKQADSLYTVLKETLDAGKFTYYPTIGNHDRYWDTDNGFVNGDELFKSYFKESYYTFESKGVRFFVLNSAQNGGETGYVVGEAQLKWLQGQLADIPAETPIVVSTHVPVYSLYYPLVKNQHVFVDMISNYKELLGTFENHNLQLVLQGHQHLHEEIKVQNVQFITGGAVCAGWWGGSYWGTEEGFLLVEISKDNLFTWKYIDYEWTPKKERK